MSAPVNSNTKPATRSSVKKNTSLKKQTEDNSSSPVLLSKRKRRSSASDPSDEPLPKRMADNQILDAINGLKNTMATKADLNTIVTEIRGLKETVIRNKDRIDTLYDMRKADSEIMLRKVEKIVEGKMSNSQRSRPSRTGDPNERSFLTCRRSLRLWPVSDVGGLERNVKKFLSTNLKMPTELIETLVFEEMTKQGQARRSKIKDEVLVRLQSSQQRDTIQSYASNLANVQGQAGIRLDIPDHLRGLFRLFEAYAAALREQYGGVKRAIRFDDIEGSLYMDVKLEETGWHRISAAEMREIESLRKMSTKPNASAGSAEEKSKILLYKKASQPSYPRVESDEEDEVGGAQ